MERMRNEREGGTFAEGIGRDELFKDVYKGSVDDAQSAKAVVAMILIEL
jgi:hypothetical protein